MPKFASFVVSLVLLLSSTAVFASPVLNLQIVSNGSLPVNSLNVPSSLPVAFLNPSFNGNLVASVGQGTPLLTMPNILDLTGVVTNISGQNSSATLALTFSNLTSPVGNFTFMNSIGGTLGSILGASSVNFSSYLDPNNSLFSSSGTLIGSCSFSSNGPFSCMPSNNINISGFGPNGYSITELVTINLAPGAIVSFDDQIQAVPEPSSLALLGTGLVGIAGMVRRRLAM